MKSFAVGLVLAILLGITAFWALDATQVSVTEAYSPGQRVHLDVEGEARATDEAAGGRDSDRAVASGEKAADQ